jgi:hypothetical protein
VQKAKTVRNKQVMSEMTSCCCWNEKLSNKIETKGIAK